MQSRMGTVRTASAPPPPGRDSQPDSWRTNLVAVLALLLSAGTLVYLGRREQIGYDSYWHIFVARQHVWSQFWLEIVDNAHPPLFYLVLKVTTLLGHAPLIYRATSIASTVVAAALLWRIARRLVVNPWLPVVAAAAFGLSYSAVNVGLEVRSYALANCLTLAALYAYLPLVEGAFAEPMPTARGMFTLFSSLALLTHYSVIFVILAALGSPLGLALVDRPFRRRLVGGWTRAQPANLVTFGSPLGVFALSYVGHVRGWATRINHVPDFMFDSARESLVTFLGRATRAELELFSPIAAANVVTVAVPVAVMAFLILAIHEHRQPGARWPVALLPSLMLAIMGSLVLVAAVAGRYPLGGPLRHQFFMLPFAILTAVVALDWVDRRLPRTWMRRLLVAAALTVCATSITSWMVTFAITPGFLAQRRMDTFRSSFPTADVVYVDQFNLITFFMHHHDWDWHLERTMAPVGLSQVWKVSKGEREMRVCRDRHWLLDFADPRLYLDLEECLEVTGTSVVAVFRPNQDGFAPAWGIGNTSALATALASEAGLRPVSLVVMGDDVFAAFTRVGADGKMHERVRIMEATYGARCGAARGNATAALERACNGKSSCRYRIDTAALGDPAVGCAKDFDVRWRCGHREESHWITIPAEAGFEGVASLGCH